MDDEGIAQRAAVATIAAVVLVVAVVVGVLLAGGDDDGEAQRPVATSSTSAASTAAGGTVGEEPELVETGASGAGCTPGGATLGDGWWFGYAAPGGLEDPVAFNLACFFVGAAADAAAVEDGIELPDGHIENDYWIRDENPAVRQVPLSPTARYACLEDDTATLAPCERDELRTGPDRPLWIRVQAGAIDRIRVQFLP